MVELELGGVGVGCRSGLGTTITTLVTTIVNLAFRDYNIYKKGEKLQYFSPLIFFLLLL